MVNKDEYIKNDIGLVRTDCVIWLHVSEVSKSNLYRKI